MENLILLLSDNRWHSETQVSSTLKISIDECDKKINSLKKMGLVIDKNQEKKYKLNTHLSLLNKKEIISLLDYNLRNIIYLQTELITNSTNDSVIKLAESNKKNIIYASTAEYQNHARGRQGRTWFNPFAATISLSLHWQIIKKLQDLEGLSLAVGMAVIKGLNKVTKKQLSLKWPNDIFFENKKLGGILIESTEYLNGTIQITIGIGINVNLTESQIHKIPQPSTDIGRVFKHLPPRNLLIAQIINCLIPTLQTYDQHGFSVMHHEWNQYDNLLGKQITLKSGNNEFSGIAQGVNNRGQFIMKTKSQTHTFNSGEVSLQLL